MQYSIAKRTDGWHVIDEEGYDVSYIGYDTKREAMDSLRSLEREGRNLA